MVKDKKKTLTISSNLKKKIDTSNIQSSSKKAFSVEKKKPFRNNKSQNKFGPSQNTNFNPDTKRKNFERKIFEKQATKDFIKELEREANTAADIADKRAKADKIERANTVERAKADREIADFPEGRAMQGPP